MTLETKELKISNELKRKVEMICKFACISDYTFENGNIVNIKNTNIAYVKPHILKVKGNDYVFINPHIALVKLIEDNSYTISEIEKNSNN